MSNTLGAVTIDEKKRRFKITSKWYSFEELLSYKVRMDNQRERAGGSLWLFKTRQSGSTTKTVTNQMDIIVTIDSLTEPIITIPVIKKPLGGKAFDKAMRYGDETKAGLDYILRHKGE